MSNAMTLMYLSNPYSHPSVAIREYRYILACEATAFLLNAGYNVFSPIVHSHPLVRFGCPTTWEYWSKIDLDWIHRCAILGVLLLPGWDISVGVTAEIKKAQDLGKPINYYEYNRSNPQLLTLANPKYFRNLQP